MPMSSIERAGIHMEQAAAHLEGAADALVRMRIGGGGGGGEGGGGGGPGLAAGPGHGGGLGPVVSTLQSLLLDQRSRGGWPLAGVGDAIKRAVPGAGDDHMKKSVTTPESPLSPGKTPGLVGLAGGAIGFALGLAVDRVVDQFDKVSKSMDAVASSVTKVNKEFLSLASVNVAATMEGSSKMLKASLGAFETATAEARSRAMQMGANLIDSLRPEIREGINKGKAQVALGAEGEKTGTQMGGQVAGAFPGTQVIGAIIGRQLGEAVANSDAQIRRSMAGLPQPTYTSADRFWEQTAVASLAMGADTIEADLFRRNLEELQKIHGALVEIKNQPAMPFPVYR